MSLTTKQKLFCKYYIEGNGNATDAVIQAGYNVHKKNGLPDKRLAASIGSENLTKPNILAYIRANYDEIGIVDKDVMRHHLFLINQFTDLPTKARGIDMYYKMTGAYNTKSEDEDYRKKEIDMFLKRAARILPD